MRAYAESAASAGGMSEGKCSLKAEVLLGFAILPGAGLLPGAKLQRQSAAHARHRRGLS